MLRTGGPRRVKESNGIGEHEMGENGATTDHAGQWSAGNFALMPAL